MCFFIFLYFEADPSHKTVSKETNTHGNTTEESQVTKSTFPQPSNILKSYYFSNFYYEDDPSSEKGFKESARNDNLKAVSYTHLTLPTSDLV